MFSLILWRRPVQNLRIFVFQAKRWHSIQIQRIKEQNLINFPSYLPLVFSIILSHPPFELECTHLKKAKRTFLIKNETDFFIFLYFSFMLLHAFFNFYLPFSLNAVSVSCKFLNALFCVICWWWLYDSDCCIHYIA